MKHMATKTINLRGLPQDLVRRAKACAALHGMTLKDFVIQAVAKATERDFPAMPSVAALSGSPRSGKKHSRIKSRR
jgi:hypothetical protein